jgi:hypothetical protein
MGMNINKMVVRKWTWQWLALLGLLFLIFHAVNWGRIELEGPISVFYDYPYSDVLLSKNGGDHAYTC